MKYPLAEKFKAPQGEGLYAGTPMAFVRLVGCSVGQTVCTACDTDFDRMLPHMGGGLYTPEEIVGWAAPYGHLCVTGGEPLDRDLQPLFVAAARADVRVHVETSGTREVPAWFTTDLRVKYLWLTVSPKPGWRKETLDQADEVKVILGGLGDGPGWPTVADAVMWADEGHLVYVQPRNLRHIIDREALARALEVVDAHPFLRLSVQLHKFVRTR